jgi:two-component system chemotaxis response regulator CheB
MAGADSMAPAQDRDVVVIGGSAGGLEALQKLVATLVVDLQAAVLVVVHHASRGDGVLPRILTRSGPLPADYAVHGEPLRRGRITVAAPGHHLLVEAGTTVLGDGPLEHWNRPAVDPLFRSAAAYGGARVLAVVLSGALDDGARGAAAVARAGGAVLVQDPDDARLTSMPRAALRAVPGACCAPAVDLGRLIDGLVRGDQSTS